MNNVGQVMADAESGTPAQSAQDALARLSVLADVPKESLCKLENFAELGSYHAGDTILASGHDDGMTLFCVVGGAVQSTKGLAQAGDIDVSTLSAGDVLDLPSCILGITQCDPSLSLTALTDCQLIMIDAAAIQEEIARSPTFARSLLVQMAKIAMRVENETGQDIGPERRVYRHLVSLATRRDRLVVIDPMPRHAALADATGVSERKAAEAVALLMADNVLERAYPLVIVQDMDTLRQMSK